VFRVHQDENVRKHVEMTKTLLNFGAIGFEHNGIKSLATPSDISMDVVGKKRAYNHRITDNETALIVQSEIAGVPLLLEHSQVSRSSNLIFLSHRNLFIGFTFNIHLSSFLSKKNKCNGCTRTRNKYKEQRYPCMR